MPGFWTRIQTDLAALTFSVEGCLDRTELKALGAELTQAALEGNQRLTLDLSQSCRQPLEQWTPFRQVYDQIAAAGGDLRVQGASPELSECLHNVRAESLMRNMERKNPEMFVKLTLDSH